MDWGGDPFCGKYRTGKEIMKGEFRYAINLK